MPVQSFTLGPGKFTVGAAALAVEAQLSNLRVEWAESVQTGDDLSLLDGGQLAGDQSATYRATVAGKLVQDLAAAGFLAWTWANKGTEQAFTFQPNNGVARKVTGVLVPVPVMLGGDVKSKPTSDFTFRCIGDPVLGNVVP